MTEEYPIPSISNANGSNGVIGGGDINGIVVVVQDDNSIVVDISGYGDDNAVSGAGNGDGCELVQSGKNLSMLKAMLKEKKKRKKKEKQKKPDFWNKVKKFLKKKE